MREFIRLFLLVMASWLWIVFVQDAAAWQLMDVYTVERMQPAQRLQWVEQQLGPYKGLINSTAKKHRIPPRLLGAVIINELADYDIKDKGQETIFSTGSVGMAQINVHTAIKHKLVDVREEEIRAYIDQYYAPRRIPVVVSPNTRGMWDILTDQEKREARQFAVERIVWYRLNQPEYAIEAAAREASWVMDQMNRNLHRTWQRSLLLGPIDRADPYRNLITDQPYEKDPEKIRINSERALALLVIAAYNTDAIIFNEFFLDSPYYQPQKGVPFYNARTHGINGMDLFAELFFRSQWLPTYGVPLPPIETPYKPQPLGRSAWWGTFSGRLEKSVVDAKVEARKKEGITATFESDPVTLNISQNGQASITGKVVFKGSLRGDKNGLTDTRRATFTLYNGTCKQGSCSGKMTWFVEGFWPHQKPPGNYKLEKPAEGTWHATGQNDGSWVLGLPNGVAPLWADIPYRLK